MSNRLCRVLLPLLLVLGFAMTIAAQNTSTPINTPNAERTELDETFELNIPERHIVKTDYEASTAVELDGQGREDLRVQVGVALRAQRIDVTLRNVTGHVRFRGSLQRIIDLLGLRIELPRVSTPPR